MALVVMGGYGSDTIEVVRQTVLDMAGIETGSLLIFYKQLHFKQLGPILGKKLSNFSKGF